MTVHMTWVLLTNKYLRVSAYLIPLDVYNYIVAVGFLTLLTGLMFTTSWKYNHNYYN